MEDQDDTPPPQKSKIPGILLYVGVLAAGVAGGYGGFAFWGTPAAAGEAPAEHGEAPAAEEELPANKGGGGGHGEEDASEGGGEAEPKRSAIVNLGVFTVNLRGSGGGRVLRMEMQLDAGEASSATIEERIPQLRDAVITAVSDYTWTELEGVDGKTRLRDELLSRLNGAIAPTTIKRLYFTQFVVQ